MRKVVHWIDDEVSKLDILIKQIQKQNIFVRTYRSGEEFFEKYHPSPVEIIFIDYYLGIGSTGLELLYRIRKEKIESRVVVISGMLDVKSTRDLIFAGASDIIEKQSPITLLKDIFTQISQVEASYKSSRVRDIYNAMSEKQQKVCDGMIKRLSTTEIVNLTGLGYSNVRKYKGQIFKLFREKGYMISGANDISKLFMK
ncbi:MULTISPECIES: response regulator [Francisella]|uniref:response regulator n=1 Tax=Francisella TaxID=262 RepID=UPI0011B5C116|nr:MULTISPECIES: response regulator [Francisella]